MQAAGELAELLERLLEVVADALEHRLGRARVVVQRLLGHPQVEGEGDEALLGAVVQVPFESPSLGDACFDDPGARVPHLVELGAQLCEETLVLEREPGCARDGVEQVPGSRSAPGRGRARRPCGRGARGSSPHARQPERRRLGCPSHVHVLVRVADPEAELERGIAQRAGDGVSQPSGLESSAQLHDQVADSDSAHARAEQPEEIRDRHDAERQSFRGLKLDRRARCTAASSRAASLRAARSPHRR